MPLIEQEIDAVLLELNGVRGRLGNPLDHFDSAHVYFVTARGALFGVNLARNHDARLLRETLECGKCLGVFFERDDALHHARAVAKNRKE